MPAGIGDWGIGMSRGQEVWRGMSLSIKGGRVREEREAESGSLLQSWG